MSYPHFSPAVYGQVNVLKICGTFKRPDTLAHYCTIQENFSYVPNFGFFDFRSMIISAKEPEFNGRNE